MPRSGVLLECLRIVDANANRAREALRVLEEMRRLGPGAGGAGGGGADTSGAAALKSLRHDLRGALARLGVPQAALLAARDAACDPGRGRSVIGAYRNPGQIENANWKRLTEALRVLEEVARLRNLAAARAFAELRFEAYEAQSRLAWVPRRRALLEPVRLYLIATPRPSGPALEPIVAKGLAGGVSMVQLRVKEGPDREILALGRRLRRLTKRNGALLIVNDRTDLALACDADGVHLGQDDLPAAEARRRVGPARIVGVSTHSPTQALSAELEGADYVGFGPLYATPTKPGRRAIGLAGLPVVARRVRIPSFAIGGIGRDTLPAVLAAGGTRVAAISAILDSKDPRREAQALLRLLDARRMSGSGVAF